MKYVDKSMIDFAYEILKEQKKASFNDIWDKIVQEFAFDNEEKKNKKVDFYNQLTVDGRFSFSDDVWSL
ncbi:MAG: DNA-directed RNA polymerase subunit delta [Bacilli bacterium]|nr:DNA-directed RNA polymerase subunit delta [Bacilli bacterium]